MRGSLVLSQFADLALTGVVVLGVLVLGDAGWRWEREPIAHTAAEQIEVALLLPQRDEAPPLRSEQPVRHAMPFEAAQRNHFVLAGATEIGQPRVNRQHSILTMAAYPASSSQSVTGRGLEPLPSWKLETDATFLFGRSDEKPLGSSVDAAGARGLQQSRTSRNAREVR